MSVRSDVLLWAQRIVGKKDAPPHTVLEIPQGSTMEDAQAAFHKLARIAHPDLHRTTLDEAELELVTLAYSRAAAAYQDFRSQRMQTTRIRPIGKDMIIPGARNMTADDAPPPGQAAPGASSMSSKALIHYRKAELSLRRGDLRAALLSLKMAIAADPQSAVLRSALAEVEGELAKNP
ncbi:MAG: hypothetical protein H0T89_07955 [Deltaproteobacteria bacterium]|nr:hypothetical protein [Deltaproteobacteria bacterium]MDQ3298348.1 hypothetical protein [Myxococcota bacterium]